MSNSLYAELKLAEARVHDIKLSIARCNHSFAVMEKSTTFQTTHYSAMDGIEVDGPLAYGFTRYRTCRNCGLYQKTESLVPGKWTEWETI